MLALHRPISLDSLARLARQEAVGGISRSVSTEIPEGRPPTPPEGASLSSSSPPQLLPLSPLQSIHLPHPASMDTTGITAGDSTWAATYESPPLPPMTILGMPILQHPQPRSAQASSGIMSPSPSAPIFQRPATAHPSTKHLPHQQALSNIEELRQSGISPYRSTTGNSTHSSLYQSRNPSPVPHTSQSPTVTTAVTGQMRSSSAQDVKLEFTAGTGHKSLDSSGQSQNLRQSYSCPLSRDTMSIPLTRQQEKAPSRNTPLSTRHTDPNNPRYRNNFRVDP